MSRTYCDGLGPSAKASKRTTNRARRGGLPLQWPAMHMLLSLVLAVIAPVAGLTEAEMEQVLAGKVPVRSETFTTQSGKSAGRVFGAIVIDKPVADVWAIISRYEDKAEYMPRLKEVTVLDKQPDKVRCKMVVDASVTTARYTAIYTLDEKERTIRWNLDKTATDNTINDVEGEYKMIELDAGRTLVAYRTWVDSGKAVPRFIQDYMAKKSVPDMLKAVKQRVESGGTYKKK